MEVNITFLGGASTVTGSKYLVRHNGHSMLVECGLFQGYKQLRQRNWHPLPLTPHQIDAVVLSHAHLDHSGYLPLLARDGYTKAIHATTGTRDLCAILLVGSRPWTLPPSFLPRIKKKPPAALGLQAVEGEDAHE